MGVINLQSGSAELTGTTIDVPITEVDLSRTTLESSAMCDDDTVGETAVVGWFTSSTNIRFQRNATGAAATIQWVVVEHDATVSVQNLSFTAPGTAAIAAVDTAKTYIQVLGFRDTGAGFDQNHSARAVLVNSTTVQVFGNGSWGDLRLQVIEYGGASVQQVTSTITQNNDFNQAITAVNTSRTAIRCSMSVDNDPQFLNALHSVRLANSTTLNYQAWDQPAGVNFSNTCFVVEHDADHFVQRGNQLWGELQGQDSVRDISISAVDLTRSVPLLGRTCAQLGLMHNNAGDDTSFARAMFTARLTSATNIRLERLLWYNGNITPWQVVEMPVGSEAAEVAPFLGEL